MREIIAAGAHCRAAPEIEHNPMRIIAMILHIARNEGARRFAADLPRGAGWYGARIDRVEIAPSRQDIEAPARWRAGGPRRNEAAMKRGEQAVDFARRALA